MRGTGILGFASLLATSQLFGGCVGDRQIGGADGSGGSMSSPSTTTHSSTSGTSGGADPSGTTTSTTTGGSGGGGGQTGPATDSIALLKSQLPAGWPSAQVDPNALVVVVQLEPQTCGTFSADYMASRSVHRVIVGLPPSKQAVGSYDLASPDVIALETDWLTDGMGNGGGGETPLTAGTIEVVSIDGTRVHVRLSVPRDEPPYRNGEHVAMRCP